MKHPEANEYLNDYISGKINLEQLNQKWADLGMELHLDPTKNIITSGGATVQENDADINGYVMADSGTGTMDKVMVKNGKLVYPNTDILFAFIGNTRYVVENGETLHLDTGVDDKEDTVKGKTLPNRPDMKRDISKAGTVVRQTTKSGVYDVYYDEEGYAVKSTKVKFN